MDEEVKYWGFLDTLGNFVVNTGILLFLIICIVVMIGMVVFFIWVGVEAAQDFLKTQRKKAES